MCDLCSKSLVFIVHSCKCLVAFLSVWLIGQCHQTPPIYLLLVTVIGSNARSERSLIKISTTKKTICEWNENCFVLLCWGQKVFETVRRPKFRYFIAKNYMFTIRIKWFGHDRSTGRPDCIEVHDSKSL